MDSSSRASIIQDLERGKHDQYSIDRTLFREEEYDSDSIPSVSDLQRTIPSTLGWWKEEYIYCAVCLAAAAGLIALLSRYDGELEPHFGGDDGLQLSTVIIAIMTAYRVALSAIVETALSQGAWIWVSAARQNRKKKTEPARLEDFKMFDEASRGLVLEENTTAVGTWSRTEFSAATSAHDDEFHFIDIPENMQANARTRYSVPLESIEVLQGFMASKMIGNYSNIDNFPDYSSDWIQAMQNATSDMPTLMSRLTLSMSNDIRMSGTLDPINGNQYEYVGAAYTQRPFVRVNWYWVIYPVVLMILAFLYLIQTVWRTARDHVSAWKGDSLPMLFAHIDKGIHQVVANGMDVPGGLTDRIGRTQIELIRRQNGKWLFKLPQRAVRRREATATSE
ncbi:hypothetical protein KJ359_010546 [Pestalotiopsis sp. 9143b]|nr:hypothetical protein KJ359_010546 [Pestalotiopsis sp. 9143b]